MVVIADTSPLHYLVLIGQAAFCFYCLGTSLSRPAVAEELQRPRTPAAVRAWMESPPAWLAIRSPRQPPVSTAVRLGAGEREALSLAQELHDDLVLLDDGCLGATEHKTELRQALEPQVPNHVPF